MDNASSVNIKVLHYKFAINEFIGLIICLAITGLTAIVIYFIKLKYGIVIDVVTFISLFVLQFIILYVVSLMQYKNLKYIIGQNSLSFQRGTFSVERETIPFEKIKNSTYDQSFIQRLFSVGDITIDQDDEKYLWEDIDSQTASLISNAISAKEDVQPITVSTASSIINATTTPPQQQNVIGNQQVS